MPSITIFFHVLNTLDLVPIFCCRTNRASLHALINFSSHLPIKQDRSKYWILACTRDILFFDRARISDFYIFAPQLTHWNPPETWKLHDCKPYRLYSKWTCLITYLAVFQSVGSIYIAFLHNFLYLIQSRSPKILGSSCCRLTRTLFASKTMGFLIPKIK